MNNIPIFLESIKPLFSKNGIHIINIYTRIKAKESVHDHLGIRIILETPTDCLRAGRLVSKSYQVVPGRYRDYVSKPWPSGYMSIHVDIEFEGVILELQIRTEKMHKTSLKLIKKYGDHYWRRRGFVR